ncbi:hypothetical protein J437_LFUL001278 [Ladona fulva]|uniref:Uncharacterized protein n=1 Tax=Ladona fulva TaxID=123851 RepID=A0A8K0NUA4_LADFU|nr:hypothetical protein J437_LFUL001278 [Ladona fulva]
MEDGSPHILEITVPLEVQIEAGVLGRRNNLKIERCLQFSHQRINGEVEKLNADYEKSEAEAEAAKKEKQKG